MSTNHFILGYNILHTQCVIGLTDTVKTLDSIQQALESVQHIFRPETMFPSKLLLILLQATKTTTQLRVCQIFNIAHYEVCLFEKYSHPKHHAFIDLEEALQQCNRSVEEYKWHIFSLLDKLVVAASTQLKDLQQLSAHVILRSWSTSLHYVLDKAVPFHLQKIGAFADQFNKKIDSRRMCGHPHHPSCGLRRYVLFYPRQKHQHPNGRPDKEKYQKYEFYFVWQSDYKEGWPGCEKPESLLCYQVVW